MALRWRRVDLDAGWIHVREGWDRVEGEQAPKSESSERDVPILGPLHALLVEHKRMLESNSETVLATVDSGVDLESAIKATIGDPPLSHYVRTPLVKDLIESGRWTLPQIAGALSVSARTIHADAVDATPLASPRTCAADEFVFGRTGTLQAQSESMLKRATRLWERAGLEPLKTHDYRHIGVSMMFAAGMKPEQVQRIIGHGSISVTYDTYGHMFPGQMDEAVQLVNSYLDQQAAPLGLPPGVDIIFEPEDVEQADG